MRSLVLMVVFVATVLSVSLWANPPKTENTAVESENRESVEVRFARAHLELAKLDLRRVMEWNKRSPNQSAATLIEQLQLHVVIDEAHLKQCLMDEGADSHDICIRSAEAAVKVAEAKLKRRRAIHNRMPTFSSGLDVDRAAVVATLAKLNLERTRALENSESVLTHLQWQIDELRHQLLELQMQVEARS